MTRQLGLSLFIAYLVTSARWWSESANPWFTRLIDPVALWFGWHKCGSAYEFLALSLSFLLIALTSLVLLFLLSRLVLLLRRSRFVIKEYEAESLFSDLYQRHDSVLKKILIHKVALPDAVAGVWLEYILDDVADVLEKLYGRKGLRASVFVPMDDGSGTKLHAVATSSLDGKRMPGVQFNLTSGFCGAAYQKTDIVCGAYRHGWRRFFRTNADFEDNPTGAQRDADRRRSYLCIPIRAKPDNGAEKFVGVLSIDSEDSWAFRAENSDTSFLAAALDRTAIQIIGLHVAYEHYQRRVNSG